MSSYEETFLKMVSLGTKFGSAMPRSILVTPEIMDFIDKSFNLSDFSVCPVDALPISARALYCIPAPKVGTLAMFLFERDEGKVNVLFSTKEKMIRLGYFVPGGAYSLAKDFLVEEEVLKRLSAILSLINQPGFVVESPAFSRQIRRRFKINGVLSESMPTKITWNVGASARAKSRTISPERCMPLHFRRAHWRRAEAHYVGAVQRPAALIEEDRAGWWQWIAEQWVGHPAFGFRESVHAPTLKLGSRLRDGA